MISVISYIVEIVLSEVCKVIYVISFDVKLERALRIFIEIASIAVARNKHLSLVGAENFLRQL